MKVSYDKKYDIAYIRFSELKPDGAVEIEEGLAVDTTSEGKIVGIEIFDASKRIQLDELFKLVQVEPETCLSHSVAEEHGKYEK
ncbi:MAG: DUF2283 domain-containing protein [Proteobacteria bacterium]|nr:DUF2283 domain-containing protein [Pseudomonadota bacterium]